MILNKIAETASRHPDAVAIQMKGAEGYRKYTYRELIGIIASAAAGLSRLGVRRGDRVAILSENRPEWMFAYFSIVSSGAVVVPLDAQLTEKEVVLLLASSEARAVCVSEACRHKVPASSSLMIINLDPGEGHLFADMIRENSGPQLPQRPEAGELAAILYTSGTTGDPKGVMLSHGNLSSNCASVIKLQIVLQTDNMLLLLPLHHTYPALACMLLPLSLGATVTILNSLKGPDIISCMKETGVTILLGVPQLFAGLRRAIFDEIRKKPAPVRLLVKLLLGLNGLLRRTVRLNIGRYLFGQVHAKFGPKFRLFASGGARLEPDVYSDMSNLGFTIIEGYGLTETSPVCTFNPLEKQKAGSIGMELPDVEVKIANPDENGMGELAVQGPNVMLGYYKKPEATAEVLRDGWFYTGDLGYRDREGYFFITGRSKEMIALSTGKKIFPEELEKFYKQVPAIKEICLLQGERGLEAAVVPDFDYLRKMNISNSRETIAFEIEDLAKDLPPYKRIMGLKIFKDPLPATRLGKLKRGKVLEMYLKGGERAEKEAPADDLEILSSEAGRKVILCIEPFSAKKKIAAEDNIELDLGLDSLARVELVVNLEKSFGISLPDSFGSEVLTVKDIVLKIQELMAAGLAAVAGNVRLSWAEILGIEPSEDLKESLRLRSGPLCYPGRFIFRTLLMIVMRLYGRMSVKGTENLPRKGPYIIALNHLSNADAPLLMSAMPWRIGSQVFFLGITRFFGGAVSSRIAKAIQVIPVDMEARLHSALQLSAYVLRNGKILCVFPEGSRSRDGSIKEFKKGVGIIAKELGMPVIPGAVSGTYEMMPAGRFIPKPGRATISFGRPFHPGDMDYEAIVKRLYREVKALHEAQGGK